jgi:hypothetical protein
MGIVQMRAGPDGGRRRASSVMSAPGTRREDAGRRHASGGRGGRRAGRLGEDLAERGSERSLGLAASGRAPPGDEPVRADEDRAVAGDLAMAYPGAARVVQVPSRWPIRSASSGRSASAASCRAASHRAWPSSPAISRNLCRARIGNNCSELVFLCPLGRSPVLVDQAVDDLSALDPGSHIDHLAGFYSGGRCSRDWCSRRLVCG